MAGQYILIVEDEADIAELLEYNLHRKGYLPSAVGCGEDGLQQIRETSPDLVLLDLMLPGLSGLEVCRQLKADPATEAIPVIMITAKGEEEDIIAGFEAGADDYVTKPFQPKVLLARVKAVLRRGAASKVGNRETLIEDPPETKEARDRFLDIINRQADRLAAIIGDLLALSRLEEDTSSGGIELQKIAVRPLLERVIHDITGGDIDQENRLTLDCSDKIQANMNTRLIEQAVGNLIDNALKYSPENTAIRITCEAGNNQISIEVTDNGPGIAAEHLPRIFERFYRVDKARSRQIGGTGLGLAIVKHIAQAHGGVASVTSELNNGSTFTLALPNEVKL